jgi:hypothetical protein
MMANAVIPAGQKNGPAFRLLGELWQAQNGAKVWSLNGVVA